MPKRFIGFAFANADFLMEVDDAGKIAFAMGAARDFGAPAESAGHEAALLFTPGDAMKFLSRAKSLKQGDRTAPFQLRLVTGATATAGMFRLPDSKTVSCTLSKVGARTPPVPQENDAATGLASRDAFLEFASHLSGDDDALTLVDVPDLPELCEKLQDGAKDLLRDVGDALRDSKAAGRMSKSSFAVVAAKNRSFLRTLRALFARRGIAASRIEQRLISLKSGGLAPAQRMLALRHAVDRFVSHKPDGSRDLSEVFGRLVSETRSRFDALAATVADGDFHLAYQPVVSLRDGALSHYEVLARFEPSGTAETIRLVEQMGLADPFDLSVALKTLSVLKSEKDSNFRLAFNVSGATIANPESAGMLAGFLAGEKALAGRVLIEITESAEIADLDAAAKAIKQIRDLGIRVGLDDFGAGAASLHYLHALPVDFVKFDGSLVEKMGRSERDDTLLRGMVKLCKELKLTTVAEFIETPEQAQRARQMGFDLGQGFHFGRADRKALPVPKAGRNVKRQGVHEAWE
ncbi:MAG TPA: EAL domain-containing protein [Rhizomicrobium sp.]|nr:EAL domain-containing protein [Rhizomicrobium sp.]